MIKSYIDKIKAYIKELKWKRAGSSTKDYLGYFCATCDDWQREPFKVRTYLSQGRHEDTIKVCKKCQDMVKEDD